MTSKKPPHLLYVVWGYPPSRGAGMYRALATANAFVTAGWDVTVLTAMRETFERLTGTDTEAESVIDPRIRVVRAPFDTSRGEPDLAKWPRSRVRSPLWWNFVKANGNLLRFPEPNYGAWGKTLMKFAQRVHLDNPVSLTIGTANPNVDFVPGAYLHRKYGVPYVMDYRDTWHLDMYSGERIGSKYRRSALIERRLLRHSLEAWFVNAPIRDWHAREYPANAQNFHVVSNGFDPHFLEGTRARSSDTERGLTFGYLGTIYGPMPMRETLEAWRLARSRSDLLRRSTLIFRGRLGHYSAPDISILSMLEEYRADGVSYGGPVSKTGVAEVYRSFDALLLILGKSRYITSGKVFEYAATGLPVASLHDVETASTSILTGYPHWFPTTDVSAESMATAVLATAERAATMTANDIAVGRAWASHLSRDKQIEPRIAALHRAVGGPPDAP